MTKERKIIIAITIISILLIAILSYFLINKNAIIEKQAEKIELQAMETNGSNSYVTTEEHLKEVIGNRYTIESFTSAEGWSDGTIGYRTLNLKVQKDLEKAILIYSAGNGSNDASASSRVSATQVTSSSQDCKINILQSKYSTNKDPNSIYSGSAIQEIYLLENLKVNDVITIKTSARWRGVYYATLLS